MAYRSEKNMATIFDKMEEDAVQTSGFYKPVQGKINQVRILIDPIRGVTAFKSAEQKVQWQFLVTTSEDPKTPLQWGVSAKGALQQILAVVKANSLTSLVGAVLQITVSGDGMERKYFIAPVSLPTPASVLQVQTEFPKAALEKAFPKLFAPVIPQAPAQ